MRVLVDLSYIHSTEKLRESVALYAFRFLKELDNKDRMNFTLLVTRNMRVAIGDIVGDGFKYEYFKDLPGLLLKLPYVKGYLRTYNWVRQIRKLDFDVVYLPFSGSGNSGRVPMRKVITIHDLRPIKGSFPDKSEYVKQVIEKLSIAFKRHFFKKHVDNASRIIAISNYVREDIIKEWPSGKGKILTVYNSVSNISDDSIAINSLQQLDYILYVNTLSIYKNVLTLIRAFGRISKDPRYKNLKLVIVGKETVYWKNDILPEIYSLGIIDKIIHINYAAEGELAWLYKHATIFVTPSIHEGFGYTPIEAAIYECPVISSTSESLPDVTAGKVKYYEPVTSYEALSETIKSILVSPPDKDELSEISKFFKNRYSPERQIKLIIDIISDETK